MVRPTFVVVIFKGTDVIELISGNVLTDKIQGAQQAIESADYDQAAELYAQALEGLGNSDSQQDIRRALWIEHVGVLIAHEQLTRALQQANKYISIANSFKDKQALFELTVLLAETLVALDDWDSFRQILSTINEMLEETENSYGVISLRAPQLTRLWGLEAAGRGNFAQAQILLQSAKEGFAASQNIDGVRLVTNDQRLLSLNLGDASVINDVLAVTDFESTYELLIYARALRRDARYEAAIELIQKRLEHHIEPPLRFPLLHELILLYQILADQETVERLLPMIEEAVSWTSNPTESRAIVDRLHQWQSQGFTQTEGETFESRLHNVRASIQQGKQHEAGLELEAIQKMADSPRLQAYWLLAAGELALAKSIEQTDSFSNYGDQALTQLSQAASLGWQYSVPEVYVAARRLIGRTYALIFNDLEMATQFWASVSRSEELIAHRQKTDMARIRYLEAAPTQYDELIETTAMRVVASNDQLNASGVIAAMEIARGATILSLILPESSQRLRDIPQPYEFEACLKWYEKIAMSLPSNLAIWILHDTPKQIHHGIIGKGILHWSSYEADRHRLHKAIDELNDCWSSETVLEHLVQKQPNLIVDRIKKVARQIFICPVLSILPKKINRLAIVAGDALADIPFATLPLTEENGNAKPLITSFSITYLPCISSYKSLAERSRKNRGDGGLIVHPPEADLLQRSSIKNFQVLDGERATITEFDALLKSNSFPIVRIDCHGTYEDESALESWLQFAHDSEEKGRLSAHRLQNLSLGNCGTLLLGACESGMAKRVGRDERIGFVRSAIAAGASSVLAARWIAEDRAAAFILDCFQHYLRFLPRDQALQKAQLDFLEKAQCSNLKSNLPQQDHPARWACWSLHGDASLQTNSNRFNLLGRRLANSMRPFNRSREVL
jgi:hypothetical protein